MDDSVGMEVLQSSYNLHDIALNFQFMEFFSAFQQLV